MALPDDAASFRVFLRRTDQPAQQDNVSIMVNPGVSLKRFLKEGGTKLGIKASKCYKFDGAGGLREIGFVDEMHMNETLVLSESALSAAAAAALAGSAAGGTSASNASAGSGGLGGADSALNAPREEVMLAILGTGGSGKSSLTLRFVRDLFVQDWDPTVEDAYIKDAELDNKPLTVTVLDTAGQEEFESMRYQWMVDKDALVFVYSVDSRHSWEELDAYFRLYEHFPHVPLALVANKKDITDLNPKMRQVLAEEGLRKANEVGAFFFEASARTNENVSEMFSKLVRAVREQKSGETKKKPANISTACGCAVS